VNEDARRVRVSPQILVTAVGWEINTLRSPEYAATIQVDHAGKQHPPIKDDPVVKMNTLIELLRMPPNTEANYKARDNMLTDLLNMLNEYRFTCLEPRMEHPPTCNVNFRRDLN
jgi:hypothetical protein